MGVDDYSDICLTVAQGTFYGNQLNLEDVCRHRQERPFLFALALDKGLADRKSSSND